MVNKILTPEQDESVELHLITHHLVDHQYSTEGIIQGVTRNEYRGMTPQELHNFVHRHNHFPVNSIVHEHSIECLAAYAEAAWCKKQELKELANT
jgi:nitrogen regulatory protein PII-like uncharacterized protein